MQLVQASVGMEFVNALMEPVCGAIRRKLKPLPREEKRKRPTIPQNIDYLQDDDVLSESEAEKQQQLAHLERERLQPAPSPSPSPQPAPQMTPGLEVDESTPLTSEPRSNVPIGFPDISMEKEIDLKVVKDDEEQKDGDEKREIEPNPITNSNPSDTIKRPSPITISDDQKADNTLLSVPNGVSDSKSKAKTPVMAPFVFLAQKSNPTLTEQWSDVLKHIALNLERLENLSSGNAMKSKSENTSTSTIGTKVLVSIQNKFSYRNMVENLSDPLLAAIEDLKCASNVEVEDIESSAKCLKYLREAHKTTLTVFRQSKDPLLSIWSATLLIVTSFVGTISTFCCFKCVFSQIPMIGDSV